VRAIGYFRETKDRSLAGQSEAFLAFCKKNGFEAAEHFDGFGVVLVAWRRAADRFFIFHGYSGINFGFS